MARYKAFLNFLHCKPPAAEPGLQQGHKRKGVFTSQKLQYSKKRRKFKKCMRVGWFWFELFFKINLPYCFFVKKEALRES